MTFEELKDQKSSYGKIIGEYLAKRCEEDKVLEEKILKRDSNSMRSCLAYIQAEAKKKAVNCIAVIEDKEVFGWAVNFFLEEMQFSKEAELNIDEEEVEVKKEVVEKPKKQAKVVKKVEKKEKPKVEQLSLFDLGL